MGLTNGWGDDIDEELQNRKKIEVGFAWNFIGTNAMITRFDQEVGETDGDYPKNQIMKMWASTLAVMLVFALLCHSALVIVGLPFFCLYGMLLFKMAKLLKRFGYPTGAYWAMTVIAVVLMAGANFLLWNVVLGGG